MGHYTLSIVGKREDWEDDAQNEKDPKKTSVSRGSKKSGRQDLNLRPLRPECKPPKQSTRLEYLFE